MGDIGGWGNHHLVDGDAARTGLVGDHPGAEHSGCVLNRILNCGRELHATCFASTTGMNLSFDDNRTAEIGDCGCYLTRVFHDAPR